MFSRAFIWNHVRDLWWSSSASVCTELRHRASNDETTLSRVITGDVAPCDFFLFPKMKFKLQGRVWYHWGNPCWITDSAWCSDRKGLPGSVPKMEEMVGPVSTCGRELLRGWWRPVVFMVNFGYHLVYINVFVCVYYVCCMHEHAYPSGCEV
jgi:hypothetical protein